MKLSDCTDLLKLLSESARLRLLRLLSLEELTVAELAQITDLKQPRVSTHLAKLKEAGLVSDRRAGVQAFYRFAQIAMTRDQMVRAILGASKDRLFEGDELRMRQALLARSQGGNWADTVAGDMERHYSPGRTWEAVVRTLLELVELGDVLDLASGDGALAALIASRARSVTCVDASKKVADAARKRLRNYAHVKVLEGDMHALALPDAQFDQALLLQALPYTQTPQRLFAAIARMLKPGGRILGSALGQHNFELEVAPFGHKNLGFTVAELETWLAQAGFEQISVHIASRERKAPHFDIIVLSAKRPMQSLAT
jgi:ubiquinone/menaquinone biosynthesis C-methylase UbiE/DNA-binding transcriptional ArsR family regulator